MFDFFKTINSIYNELKTQRDELQKYLDFMNNNIYCQKEIMIDLEKELILHSNPKYVDQRSLVKFQSQVYSQNNEDGIIAEIFNRIGLTDKVFVEIGVGNGLENNTRFLLEQGWHGFWLEGSADSNKEIKKSFKNYIDNQQLYLIESFITTENILELFKTNKIPECFDFLSIDIDMNTHHIWEMLEKYKPRVVCIEYNASIPPNIDFCVPYKESSSWDGSNFFGAGLKTLENIGKKLGYSIVGCDYVGVNAYFVKNDLLSEELFLSPFCSEFHYEPPRYHLLSHRGHPSYIPKKL